MVAAGQGIQALCLLLGMARATLEEHIVRLCLPTPHDRPLRKPGPKAWSVMDKIRVMVWRPLGVHPEIIGQRLDKPRSANAVRAQSRRMGIAAPARRDLHKPDPASLQEPDLAALFGQVGLNHRESAIANVARIQPKPAADALNLCGTKAGVSANDVVRPPDPISAAKGRAAGRAKVVGQRQLPLLVLVGGTDKEPSTVPATPVLPPVPETIEEIDLCGDLTWFGRLTWTNPLKNRVAVWTFFMLIAGGLHYKAAAGRLGITPDAFRSIRTRMAVPVDPDRTKAGTVFDKEGAWETLERSGYVIKKCIQSDNLFWRHKDDHKTRYSPPYRKRERLIGERSNLFEIVTRRMLNAEMREKTTPFATSSARVYA